MLNNKEENKDLQSMFNKLEVLITMLESEDISLEQSFELYKQGMETVKECGTTIDEIEKKVMVLDGDGNLQEF